MKKTKNCYYDVLGPADRIYIQHFKTDGFVQDWLHFHSKYELSLVLSGDVEVISGRTACVSSKPHLRLHRPFEFHTANAKQGLTSECFVFYFTAESLQSVGQSFDLRSLFRDGMTMTELDGDILECARALSSIVLLDIDDKMRGIVLAGLLSLTERSLNRSGPISCGDQLGYIGSVLEYIESHLSENISAAELAKRCFISEQKLCADFKSHMNETLHQYVVSARITRAAMLIAKGMSPDAASAECGFSDETHFQKSFKKRMGMTPRIFAQTVGKVLEFSEDFDEKDTKVPPRHK